MNSKLFRGSLDTIILKLLEENDRMYGYEISKSVLELTSNKVKVTEGALYPALHKLEGQGFIVSESVNIGNRYRKYYTLTKPGKTQLMQALDEMREFINNLNLILEPNLPLQ